MSDEYFSRKNTIRLLELIDEGVLDPIQVLTAALNWHSDHEVGEMAESNQFFSLDNDDDEEDDEEDIPMPF